MAFKIYNTMSRTKEELIPLDAEHVRMYTCGPTVYNYAHIGNFRAYMFEDLLRRYIKFCGFKVTQVHNLTDVDDKTIRSSIETPSFHVPPFRGEHRGVIPTEPPPISHLILRRR